jgi:hypothetical protein
VKLDPDNDEYVNSDIKQCIAASILKLSMVPGFNDNVRKTVEDALLSRANLLCSRPKTVQTVCNIIPGTQFLFEK